MLEFSLNPVEIAEFVETVSWLLLINLLDMSTLAIKFCKIQSDIKEEILNEGD